MDQALLLWINQGLSHPWLDTPLAWISDRNGFTFPLFLTLLAAWAYRYGRAGAWLWLTLVIVVLCGDAAGNVLKHATQQLRPCAELGAQVRHVDTAFTYTCSHHAHGMPSNHTLNAFTALAFVAVVLRAPTWTLLFAVCAVLIGYSRMYLGVHYPSQVLVGAVLGTGIGLLGGLGALKCLPYTQRLRPRTTESNDP